MMFSRAIIGSALVTGLLAAAAAAGEISPRAAGWSARHMLLTESPTGTDSPAPAAAAARDGTLAVAFRRAGRPSTSRVAVADGTRRFTLVQTLDRFHPAKLAAARRGRIVAVMSRKHDLVAFVRPRRGTRFGQAVRIAKVADNLGPLFDFDVAMNYHGDAIITWVAQTSRRAPSVLHVRRLSRSGKRGPVQKLDRSRFVAASAPVVNARGAAAVAWTKTDGDSLTPGTTVHVAVSESPSHRFAATETAAVTPAVDPGVAIDGHGRVALTYLQESRRGDAGSRGRPVLQVKAPGAALGVALQPPVPSGRGLIPQVAFASGGHPVLVYQVKDRVSGFTVAAPVWSTVATPTGTTLTAPRRIDARQVTRPRIGSVAGGVLVLSPAPAWSAAIVSATGRVTTTPAPPGSAHPYADANGNRALATAGSYAALIWEQSAGPKRPYVVYFARWKKN